jgi:hypothetical protein
MKLSIVIPCYNEARIVRAIVDRARAAAGFSPAANLAARRRAVADGRDVFSSGD